MERKGGEGAEAQCDDTVDWKGGSRVDQDGSVCSRSNRYSRFVEDEDVPVHV